MGGFEEGKRKCGGMVLGGDGMRVCGGGGGGMLMRDDKGWLVEMLGIGGIGFG